MRFERQEKNRREPKIRDVRDQETQCCFDRPPLQTYAHETDFYNCFDSVFNGDGFKYDNVVTNNHILASKRHHIEWETRNVRK